MAHTNAYPSRIIDAHCHLQDDRLAPHIDAVLERARAAGVVCCISCGTCEEDWGRLAALAGRHKDIVPAYGLHPWHIERRTGPWFEQLKERCVPAACSIGEIGLDFAIDTDRDLQETVFMKQLELSMALRVPVSIHCRRAWGRMALLLKAAGAHPAGLIFHAYAGSAEMVPMLAACNGFFSFSGSLTFEKNRRDARALQQVPPDRLLLETDSPDGLPCMDDVEPRPGYNEPARLTSVLCRAAELLAMPAHELATITTANARRLFTLPAHE